MGFSIRLCIGSRNKDIQKELFLVGVYSVTLWAGQKTQLLIPLDKNVIWTNKLWTAVYLRETFRDKKTHNWIFPQSLADVFVSKSLQAVIPTWKASTSCLLMSVTTKDRDPGTSMSWPHARGKCIHPQPAPQCQLHSLDLINILNKQNKHSIRSSCSLSLRMEVIKFRASKDSCLAQKEGKDAKIMTTCTHKERKVFYTWYIMLPHLQENQLK